MTPTAHVRALSNDIDVEADAKRLLDALFPTEMDAATLGRAKRLIHAALWGVAHAERAAAESRGAERERERIAAAEARAVERAKQTVARWQAEDAAAPPAPSQRGAAGESDNKAWRLAEEAVGAAWASMPLDLRDHIVDYFKRPAPSQPKPGSMADWVESARRSRRPTPPEAATTAGVKWAPVPRCPTCGQSEHGVGLCTGPPAKPEAAPTTTLGVTMDRAEAERFGDALTSYHATARGVPIPLTTKETGARCGLTHPREVCRLPMGHGGAHVFAPDPGAGLVAPGPWFDNAEGIYMAGCHLVAMYGAVDEHHNLPAVARLFLGGAVDRLRAALDGVGR